MKRIIKLSLLLLALLLPATASAYDFVVDGIYYYIDGNNAIVTYQQYVNNSYQSDYSGDVTIPETVTYNGTTYSVTTIGNYAFRGCSGLTSVNIPNSVTTIGGYAFFGCSGLTSIDIPNSVTTIGVYAFYDCSKLRTLLFNAVNCTSIGYRAFYYYNISNLQFGENVEHIPAGMPGFNMNGKNLVLPHSVKTIEAGALNGNCDAVVIGNGIEDIAPGAFGNSISVAYASSAEPRPCQAGAFANPQTLYVPAGSKNKYFTAPGWSEFANIIEGEYVAADSIILDQTTAVLLKGATLQLNASFMPDNASVASVGWYSKNPNIATVDANGLVTAIAIGETDVVACADNVTATCHVTVTPVLVESLTLSDNHLSMALDETYTLIADITPDNAENKALEWEIPDNDVIVAQVVNNNRLNISAEGEGTVTITVRSTDGSDLSATCEVFVSATTPVKTLTLTPESLDLFVNDTWHLNATVTPQDAYNKDLRWMSSNPNVATVDGNGLVTARGVGNATITVMTTDGSNLSATCAVTVTNVPVESITLNLTELEMNPGGTYTLNASVQPSNAFNKTLDWVSSNPSVATVTNNGRITAVGVGSTIVMAMATDGSNVSAACRVTVNSQSASNCFVVANAEMLQGDTIVIPVALTNTQTIVAFQTDIYLPEGFTIVTDEDDEYVIHGSSRLTSDHVIMADNANNGSVRVICYNPAEQPISGNEGDLFYMTIRVPDDASGDYAVNLRNNLLTNTDYQELAIPDAGAVLTVKTFMPGDVNDSRTVTVTDIVVTAQYVLDRNPSPFIFEAADMNGDGNVTVTDIMLIAYLINHPTMNAPKRMPPLTNCNDRMSGEGVSLLAGETRTVSITLDNEMDYTAFQLDLTLPAGLTASNFALTDRAGSHALDVNTLDNGKIRALCYSPAIEVIDGNSGALLTFDVTATDAIEGDITVDGIELVTVDCQTVLMNSFTIGVNSATSVNELNGAKTVARVDYFNLAGQRIDRPESGVTLVVTTYTDGTRTTTKVIK